MYPKALNYHTGDLYKLYIIQEWPLPYYYAYCPFPCGSRLLGYPVLCIIHNSEYIFNLMHITQRAL